MCFGGFVAGKQWPGVGESDPQARRGADACQAIQFIQPFAGIRTTANVGRRLRVLANMPGTTDVVVSWIVRVKGALKVLEGLVIAPATECEEGTHQLDVGKHGIRPERHRDCFGQAEQVLGAPFFTSDGSDQRLGRNGGGFPQWLPVPRAKLAASSAAELAMSQFAV